MPFAQKNQLLESSLFSRKNPEIKKFLLIHDYKFKE